MKKNKYKIAVCVKAVPENPSDIVLSENTRWPDAMGQTTGFRINRFDEYAVEAALIIKESHPGTVVDIVSCGNAKSTESIIRRALGMGADNGWLIRTAASDIMTPRAIAENLAAVLTQNPYDIILTGAMSEDEMNGQTGPMTGACLGMPVITGVSRITPMQDVVDIKRDAESGTIEILTAKYPILLSVLPGINVPRYPVLSAVLKAQKKTIFQSDFSPTASSGHTSGFITIPEKTRQGKFINGTVQEQAAAVYSILSNLNALSLP